jgi:hypothetical protein
MSHFKRLLLFVFSGFLLTSVYAESQRTLFSLENQFPRWEQFEVGAYYQGSAANDDTFYPDTSTSALFIRYGILDNLAVKLELPYVGYDFPTGANESGIGDMTVEFQLKPYEDIFGYPYFIPHVSFSLPTGDENKGLGVDGTTVILGIAYGSTINDWIDWVIDLSYKINPDFDDQMILANSYIWNLSEEFSLVTEVMYEEAILDGTDSKVLVTAGFSYDWTDSLQFDVNVGGGLTGPEDVIGQARFSYSF